jgi:hypothetical protein
MGKIKSQKSEGLKVGRRRAIENRGKWKFRKINEPQINTDGRRFYEI